MEVNRLLQLKETTNHQVMSYDTTFKLGDFYISPLLFRNIIFCTSPVMPDIFMLHKLKSTHEEMMRIVTNELHCQFSVNGDSVVPLD